MMFSLWHNAGLGVVCRLWQMWLMTVQTS